MKLKLLKKKRLDGDIYEFTFIAEAPITWRAGQQMVFTLPHSDPDNLGISRTFSIASAPFEEVVTILTHCHKQGSSFKQALKSLAVGEEIEASEPRGEFVIKDPLKDHVFIATGVGIAPIRAMLVDLDYHSQPLHITLIYGHTSEHFPYKDEFEELMERHAGFKVFYSIDPHEKERGRIKEVLAGVEGNPIYMSGIYIRKIAEMLDRRDTVPRHLVHEGVASDPITEEESTLACLWGE